MKPAAEDVAGAVGTEIVMGAGVLEPYQGAVRSMLMVESYHFGTSLLEHTVGRFPEG